MPSLGQKQTPEARIRISMAMKGRKPSPQTIEASVKAHKGKHLSKETLQKMGQAQHKRRGSKEDRFFRRVRKTRNCWWWEGATAAKYPLFAPHEMAHRVSYELFIGPIKKGNHIHHICHNRLCVKPDHLEQVSGRDHKYIHSRPDGWERYLYRKDLN